MRRRRISLTIIGLVAFVVISGLLARAFSVEGAEQSAVTDVLRAEARGDAAGIVSRIMGCAASPQCVAGAASDAARLRHSGTVQVIEYNGSAGFSVTGSTGTARVAWVVGGSKPIVQCIRVHRGGSIFTGFHVELLTLSEKIHSDADCPKHFTP